MLSLKPKIPGWIQAEIETLAKWTLQHNVVKLRERRVNPQRVRVAIYHRTQGEDAYFCDVRKKYLTWKQLTTESGRKDV